MYLYSCFQTGGRGRKAGRFAKSMALDYARAERKSGNRGVKVKRVRHRGRILYCVVKTSR